MTDEERQKSIERANRLMADDAPVPTDALARLLQGRLRNRRGAMSKLQSEAEQLQARLQQVHAEIQAENGKLAELLDMVGEVPDGAIPGDKVKAKSPKKE